MNVLLAHTNKKKSWFTYPSSTNAPNTCANISTISMKEKKLKYNNCLSANKNPKLSDANISKTLMQMKSNSCIYPIHSLMLLQYCCLNSPTRPAREGCHPSSQATHLYTQPCTRRLWLKHEHRAPLPITTIKSVQSPVNGVVCLSLSSMIPPAIMEQPHHNQTDQSQHRHADQRGHWGCLSRWSAGVEADGN